MLSDLTWTSQNQKSKCKVKMQNTKAFVCDFMPIKTSNLQVRQLCKMAIIGKPACLTACQK
jgi:hypothetical protein